MARIHRIKENLTDLHEYNFTLCNYTLQNTTDLTACDLHLLYMYSAKLREISRVSNLAYCHNISRKNLVNYFAIVSNYYSTKALIDMTGVSW